MPILAKTHPEVPEITTPLVRIRDPLFDDFDIQVYIKREELNHPHIQGNKWHKLKFNLKAAQKEGKTALLTFGGAYSNHIAATAYAGKAHGFNTIGLIRGDELENRPERWNKTLQNAHANGMKLAFISRRDYRRKAQADFIKSLKSEYPQAYLLPEGGSNPLAIMGFQTVMQDLERQCPSWTHLYTPVGTGGTLAGLVRYADNTRPRNVRGVTVLKKGEHLLPQIQSWIGTDPVVNWSLLTDYHDGGYGKLSTPLKALKSDFERRFQIRLDPVYTIKMLAAFYDELQKGLLPAGSKVILMHTGGLQGNSDGFSAR